MVFTKKVFRDLKKDFVRYLLIMIVIILGIGVSVAYSNVYESVRHTVLENWKNCNIEDGEFSVYIPLDDEQSEGFEKMGAELEKAFYVDFNTDNDLTVRLFRTREKINTLNLREGNMPQNDNEIVIDKVFAENNSLNIGDNIILGSKNYKICGKVTAVDYLQRIRELSDAGTSSMFGIGFVNNEAFETVIENNNSDIVYNYSYILKGASYNELKEYLFGLDKIVTPYDSYDMLYSFTEKENNSRIVYGYKSVESEKTIGIIASVAVGLLVSYIISVFAVNAINDESESIGLLFAMGYGKKKIAIQYTRIPVSVVAIGSILGCIFGKYMTRFLISSTYSYPEIEITFPFYMLIWGFAIPVIFAFIINYFAVSQRLNATPLSLMRKEKKRKNIRRMTIHNKNFIKSFRLNQLFSEIKGYFVTVLGMILAIMIMMIGIAMDSTISHFADEALADVKYNTMYVLATQPDEMPDSAEAGIIKSYSLKYDFNDTYFTVMVAGISPENEYFDFSEKVKGLGKDEVLMSSAVAEKFGYKIGDIITVSDLLHDEEYSFKVKDTTDYSYGFYIFMNLDSMRKYYNTSDNYYNTLYSSEILDKENMNVVYESTYESVQDTVDNWIKLGRSEFIMFSIISVLIFVIVTFLLIKSMIEHSSFNISMLKIMGYDNSDVSKIYINQNIYVVLISTIIGLPLSRLIIGRLVNTMTASMKCYMPAYIGSLQFMIAIGIIIISYIISTVIVKRHINNISYAEVLKNRD